MVRAFIFFFAIIMFLGCNDTFEPKLQTKPEGETFATRAAVSGDYYYGSDGKIPIVKSTDKAYVLYRTDAAKLQQSLSAANPGN